MNNFVVDANSLYARSWFAAQRISPEPKEAIRLAVNTILLLLNPDTNKIGCQFDRSLFAWDSHQNKAKSRDEKPPEYHETKAVLKDVLSFMLSTVHVECPDVEGDDIAATAVYNTDPKDTVYVISGDKDLMQLQGGNCQYYSLNDKAVLQPAYITAKFEHIYHPNQVALYLAVVGDQVDKIGGITNFGPVKFKKLMEAVSPKMSLAEAAEAIARQLTDSQLDEFYAALERTVLRTDVPGVPAPAEIVLAPPEEVEDLGIPQIAYYYRQVYHTYTVEPY